MKRLVVALVKGLDSHCRIKKNRSNSILKKTGSGYLEFDQVSFSWSNGVNVIDQCSFSIVKPGLWMLVGENGSGKSTLFRLINGVIRP